MSGDTPAQDLGAYPKFIRLANGTHLPVRPLRRDYFLMTPTERRAEIRRILTPIATTASIDFCREVRSTDSSSS